MVIFEQNHLNFAQANGKGGGGDIRARDFSLQNESRPVRLCHFEEDKISAVCLTRALRKLIQVYFKFECLTGDDVWSQQR